MGNAKRLDRLDSFEKRMEDSSSNIFTAESKHDYSFKSESTRSIPIRCEDTPPRSGSYDPPPEGYTLKDAIDEELFDPVAGLFSIPGTDRETSFQECLELHIINGYSATVSHQSNKYSLKNEMHNKVVYLDQNCCTSNPRYIYDSSLDFSSQMSSQLPPYLYSKWVAKYSCLSEDFIFLKKFNPDSDGSDSLHFKHSV